MSSRVVQRFRSGDKNPWGSPERVARAVTFYANGS